VPLGLSHVDIEFMIDGLSAGAFDTAKSGYMKEVMERPGSMHSDFKKWYQEKVVKRFPKDLDGKNADSLTYYFQKYLSGLPMDTRDTYERVDNLLYFQFKGNSRDKDGKYDETALLNRFEQLDAEIEQRAVLEKSVVDFKDYWKTNEIALKIAIQGLGLTNESAVLNGINLMTRMEPDQYDKRLRVKDFLGYADTVLYQIYDKIVKTNDDVWLRDKAISLFKQLTSQLEGSTQGTFFPPAEIAELFDGRPWEADEVATFKQAKGYDESRLLGDILIREGSRYKKVDLKTIGFMPDEPRARKKYMTRTDGFAWKNRDEPDPVPEPDPIPAPNPELAPAPIPDAQKYMLIATVLKAQEEELKSQSNPVTPELEHMMGGRMELIRQHDLIAGVQDARREPFQRAVAGLFAKGSRLLPTVLSLDDVWHGNSNSPLLNATIVLADGTRTDVRYIGPNVTGGGEDMDRAALTDPHYSADIVRDAVAAGMAGIVLNGKLDGEDLFRLFDPEVTGAQAIIQLAAEKCKKNDKSEVVVKGEVQQAKAELAVKKTALTQAQTELARIQTHNEQAIRFRERAPTTVQNEIRNTFLDMSFEWEKMLSNSLNGQGFLSRVGIVKKKPPVMQALNEYVINDRTGPEGGRDSLAIDVGKAIDSMHTLLKNKSEHDLRGIIAKVNNASTGGITDRVVNTSKKMGLNKEQLQDLAAFSLAHISFHPEIRDRTYTSRPDVLRFIFNENDGEATSVDAYVQMVYTRLEEDTLAKDDYVAKDETEKKVKVEKAETEVAELAEKAHPKRIAEAHQTAVNKLIADKKEALRAIYRDVPNEYQQVIVSMEEIDPKIAAMTDDVLQDVVSKTAGNVDVALRSFVAQKGSQTGNEIIHDIFTSIATKTGLKTLLNEGVRGIGQAAIERTTTERGEDPATDYIDKYNLSGAKVEIGLAIDDIGEITNIATIRRLYGEYVLQTVEIMKRIQEGNNNIKLLPLLTMYDFLKRSITPDILEGRKKQQPSIIESLTPRV